MTKPKAKPKPKQSVDYSKGVEYIHAESDTIYIITTAADAANLERAGWTIKPKLQPKGVK